MDVEEKRPRLPVDIANKIDELGHEKLREAIKLYEEYRGSVENMKRQASAADLHVKETKKKSEELKKIQGILAAMNNLIEVGLKE